MTETTFKLGDFVKFNVGTATGPIYFGTVVAVHPDGRWARINPQKAGVIGGVQFFNVSRVS